MNSFPHSLPDYPENEGNQGRVVRPPRLIRKDNPFLTSIDSISTERFSYHSLFLSTGLPLLNSAQQLVLDHFTGYSMVIDWEAEMIQNATTFTKEELTIVLTLAGTWPSFSPYEALMTNESGERLTPSQIDDARSAHYLDTVIAPLRELIKACLVKLQMLGLDIREIDQYGYRLSILNKHGEGNH